jgi:hypothetical protein
VRPLGPALILVTATGAWLVSAPLPALEVLRLDAASSGGIYTIDAELVIDAPPAAVHAVITDYEHLTNLSPRIEESRVLEKESNATLVFTRVVGCFAFFCRTIDRVERVVEFGPDHVEATTLPDQSDVGFGKVVWVLHASGEDATRVEYYTALEPTFWVPPLVGRIALRRSMEAEAMRMFANIETVAAQVVIER